MTPPVNGISADDIQWVSDLLNLKSVVGSRQEFLKCLSTVDVTACPGSGKTTLLVAKLALLGKNWNNPNSGICALSHTNVAKDEITNRLGGTGIESRITRYPNYIDTIHGFANRFLASPFLISIGQPATNIDDDATTLMRTRALSKKDSNTLEQWLGRRRKSIAELRISSLDPADPLAGQDFGSKPTSKMYELATQAVIGAAKAGFYCYDDILTIGILFAESSRSVTHSLRLRFPVVLIDEMQDTSSEQNKLIRTVFGNNDNDCVIQRVGDPNQAIYGNEGSSGVSEKFPDPETLTLCLDDSFRFDPTIARLANPFAVLPVAPNGLQGMARTKFQTQHRAHKVFVFPDHDPSGVLNAYGAHVASTLPIDLIPSAKVHAVGAVVRESSDIEPQHKHFPKSVSHYWNGYNPKASRNSFKPDRLIDYFTLANVRINSESSSHHAVNLIAAGIFRLTNKIASRNIVKNVGRPHVHIIQLLEKHPSALSSYNYLLTYVINGGSFGDRGEWESAVPLIFAIAEALGSAPNGDHKVVHFLEWRPGEPILDSSLSNRPANVELNLFRYESPTDERVSLDIEIGSVHSVKGETHTATLLLETFYYEHHLSHLIPWFAGGSSELAERKISARTAKFMRWAYVALTRPTHISCIALPQRALNTSILDGLNSTGWSVEYIQPNTNK